VQSELESQKPERQSIAQEIRLAAADKDFRENAPLEAAKERQGHVEGKIRELETTLNAAAVVVEKGQEVHRARMHSTVVLSDLVSGEELTYTLVGPRDIAPLEGKISILSPVGKAVMDHQEGETVKVAAPSGTLSYRIKKITV
jgi:transcription elongation factor GreA